MRPDAVSYHIKKYDANSLVDLTWDNHDFVQLLLCCSGNIQIDAGSKVYNITESDLLIHLPKKVISIKEYSDNFYGYIISIPRSIIERNSIIRFPIWLIYNKLNQRMLFSLDKEDYDALISYINLLEIRAGQSYLQESPDVTHNLITSLIIDK